MTTVDIPDGGGSTNSGSGSSSEDIAEAFLREWKRFVEQGQKLILQTRNANSLLIHYTDLKKDLERAVDICAGPDFLAWLKPQLVRHLNRKRDVGRVETTWLTNEMRAFSERVASAGTQDSADLDSQDSEEAGKQAHVIKGSVEKFLKKVVLTGFSLLSRISRFVLMRRQDKEAVEGMEAATAFLNELFKIIGRTG